MGKATSVSAAKYSTLHRSLLNASANVELPRQLIFVLNMAFHMEVLQSYKQL